MPLPKEFHGEEFPAHWYFYPEAIQTPRKKLEDGERVGTAHPYIQSRNKRTGDYEVTDQPQALIWKDMQVIAISLLRWMERYPDQVEKWKNSSR